MAACLTIVCVLGLMVIAQAAGIDVFGTMARWTDEVFSLGTVRSSSVGYVPPEERTEYGTLQEALDAYQVIEISAPTWIPEGYILESIDAEYWDDIKDLSFNRYALLICKFGTEIVALTLHFCFDCILLSQTTQ